MAIANLICFVGASVVFNVGPGFRAVILDGNNAMAVRLAKWSLLAGIAYFLVVVLVYGGFSAFVTASFKHVKTDNSGANSATVVYWAAYVMAVASYHFYVPRKKAIRSNKSFRPSATIWVSVGLLLASILAFTTGGRNNLILLLFAILCKHLIGVRVTKQAFRLAILTFVAGVISAVVINLRHLSQAVHGSASTSGSKFSAAVTGVTFIDHIAQSMLFAGQNGFDYGIRYLKLPLFFIPRSLWPDKPLPLSQLMRGFVFGDEQGGIPPGLFGESYIAFGAIGILLTAVLWAFVLSKVDGILKFARRSSSAYHSMLVAVLAPLISFMMVRGGTDIGIYRVTFPMFWCWFVHRWTLNVQKRERT